MTWTSPGTAVANTFLTAAFWNTHVRDNLLETAPAKATAAGQLFQATAANVIAALNPVAYRMPRSNAAANLMEYIAGLNLAQAILFNTAANVNTANVATDIVTQAITSVGGAIVVIAFADLFENKSVNNTAALHTYSLRRDTTDLIGPITYATRGFTDALPNSSSNRAMFYKETPGAGTYTYKVRTSYQTISTNGTPTSNGAILIAELAP